jgi:hypothetical protein
MNRTSSLKTGGPLQRSGFNFKGANNYLGLRRKIVGKIKSRGMKGRTPTAEERCFMDAIGSLGCLACAKDGVVNPWISLHHIQGRTAPGAHFLVLGLCAPHHQQDDSDPMRRLSVHGHRTQFEAKYGTQLELLAEAKQKLGLA